MYVSSLAESFPCSTLHWSPDDRHEAKFDRCVAYAKPLRSADLASASRVFPSMTGKSWRDPRAIKILLLIGMGRFSLHDAAASFP